MRQRADGVDSADRVEDEQHADRAHRVRPTVLGVASLLVVLAALVGVTLSLVGGWEPVGDEAVVAGTAQLVGQGEVPALGMPNSFAQYTGIESRHPGPLLVLWLAPWVAVFGRATGAALGAATLHLMALLCSGWMVRRIGGDRFALAFLIAAAFVATQVAPNNMVRPLNSAILTVPLFALLVAAWSSMSRDRAGALVLLVTWSFVVQAHLGYAVVATAVAVPSIAVYLVQRDALSRRRDIVVGPLLLAGLWAGPLIDVVIHRGGNVADVMASVSRGGVDGLGPGASANFVLSLLALPGAGPPDVALSSPPTVRALVLAIPIGILVGWTVLHGRPIARRALAVVLAAVVGGAVTAAQVPDEPIEFVQVLWAPVIGVFSWSVLSMCAIFWLRDARQVRWTPGTVVALLVAGPAFVLAGAPFPTWPLYAIATVVIGTALWLRSARGAAWTPRTTELAVVPALVVMTLSLSLPISDSTGPSPDRFLQDVVDDARAPISEWTSSSERILITSSRSIDADRVAQSLIADRIVAERPIAVQSTNYWGTQRGVRTGDPPTSVVYVTDRPLRSDADARTVFARTGPDDQTRRDLTDEIRSFVRAADRFTLTDDGLDGLAEALDGRLPGGCEDLESYRSDPQLIVEQAPSALVDLFTRGWVEAPRLLPNLQRRVDELSRPGIWIHLLPSEGVDMDAIGPRELVLSRLGCTT